MLEIGTLVDGKYKILSKIGSGGMSVVYMAINEKANKTWAIKEIRKEGIKDFNIVRQGMLAETELLKKLRHPNLPSIVDVIEETDDFLIVMDYIEGNPLSRRISETGPQPEACVIEWAQQLCSVLGYLHSRSPAIIYRDMKPANIMLKPDGNLMLIDFGTAREFKTYNTADTISLGTAGYAAPEQFERRRQTDARTDIYCLGTTLYHLITGLSPCESPYPIKPIRKINPALSGGLELIIMKCTNLDPQKRYQDCEELSYAIGHYAEIDDLYKFRQKRKLGIFISSFIMSIVLAVISLWAYQSADITKKEEYSTILKQACDLNLSQPDRIQKYVKAISTDATRTEAYLDMLDMFLAANRILTKEESLILMQLQLGIAWTDQKGKEITRYPLEQLRRVNPDGYGEVCFEIGLAYWYDYIVESDRHIAAMEWFQEAAHKYELAQLYCMIGECQWQIDKYAGQNRMEMLYETYQKLWENIKNMHISVQHIQNNDVKLLVWPELIEMLSAKSRYFLVHIEEIELLELLDTIRKDAKHLKDISNIGEVKESVNSILDDIEAAKQRIESVND